MPNILTNPFFWVALFATVVLAVAVGFLVLVFRYAANRNQSPTLVAQGPVAPQSTSTLQNMTKVIFNWKTIMAVGLVVLGAYLVSNYLSIIPDWQTVAGAVTGGLNWTVEFVTNYGIWALVAVPLYLAVVGYNQNKMRRSYTGDVLYYVLGGGAVIGGVGLVVIGKDLLFRAVAQSRGKTRATFECWYLETTSVDCDAVSQIAAPTIDWGVIVLCLFGVAFLGGLWKMKVIQQTTALGATVIVLPFMLWLAWGTLPSDFREDVLEIAPFVQSEAEVTRELNLSIAAAANAEANRTAQQRLYEAQLQERNAVKFFNHEIDQVYHTAEVQGRISDVEIVQLRMGGDRHYREASDTWRVAAYPPGQVSFVKHDPDGDGIANGYWVNAQVPLAKVVLYNGIRGETFRRVTF